MMKTIKIFTFIVTLALFSIPTFGQNADFYKQQIEVCLSRGDCDKAQTMYDAWKELTKQQDPNIESRIETCRRGGSTIVPTSDYVEINGVKWAKRNVGSEGKFVAKPENLGNYYNLLEAQKVCPLGWRTPTQQEFENLNRAGSKWIIENGISGRQFGSGNNIIFLPAAGSRDEGKNLITLSVGKMGDYWSATLSYEMDNNDNMDFFGCRFSFDNTQCFTSELRGICTPIRCVVE